MYDVVGGKLSVLFRLDNNEIFSIPAKYIDSVELLTERVVPIPHSPNYIVGMHRFHNQNINIVELIRLLGLGTAPNHDVSCSNLLIVINSAIGLLVKEVIGAKSPLVRQDAGALPNQLIRSVCSFSGVDDIALELDIPQLLFLYQQMQSS